jgi:hypothetical protein
MKQKKKGNHLPGAAHLAEAQLAQPNTSPANLPF